MKKFAVFDIDGTLIRWQLYHAVVHELAKRGALGKDALTKVNAKRMIWKTRQDPNAWKIYESVIVAVYESALNVIDTKQFDEAVLSVIERYKDQTYSYTKELLTNLKSKGYFLLIISGSHHEMIELLARYYGFDDWLGSQYLRKNGKFSGEKHIATFDKGKTLAKFVDKHELTYDQSIAIGDSGSDISMLELVHKPIAFNPDQILLNHAKSKNWKIIVERKNVIYELESRDGKYILA